jgi:hypothetical protein
MGNESCILVVGQVFHMKLASPMLTLDQSQGNEAPQSGSPPHRATQNGQSLTMTQLLVATQSLQGRFS